ncbi:MAG: archaemetzincin family Zn-dependent metalloprotease [Thermoanaerobaculia bacterium]|nr:archaemetzincin family Zn-dependent metalloprotease [Thermoanaerobaculia bacterium]
MRPVVLVPLGEIERPLLHAVRAAVMRELRAPCTISPRSLDPAFAFHPERNQYHSTTILEQLKSFYGRGEIVVGITPVDLFIPILTYVFGEAQLSGSCAVVSYHRMHQALYGLEPDDSLLAERLSKTAIHEIGHTRGLTHCDDYNCVMAAAHAVEWLDVKGHALCAWCRGASRVD